MAIGRGGEPVFLKDWVCPDFMEDDHPRNTPS